MASANEYKLEAVKEILGQKLVKRGVSLKNLTYGKVEPAAGQSVRQKITLQQGIPTEKAKEIVAHRQRLKKEGAGEHSRRYCESIRQRSRRPAGHHCHAAGQGPWRGADFHELPHELKTRDDCGAPLSTLAIATAKEVFELLREDLVAIEQELGRDAASSVSTITEIAEYLREGGGKRIRPSLLLLAAHLLDYSGPERDPARRGGRDGAHRDAGARRHH